MMPVQRADDDAECIDVGRLKAELVRQRLGQGIVVNVSRGDRSRFQQ